MFDYGEYQLEGLDQPGSDPWVPVRSWAARPDAWSSFRPGFDLRTQRLCRNIVLFHRFGAPGEAPALVRSWQLRHTLSPAFATLESLTEIGWRRRADGSYEKLALPATVFDYSSFDPPQAPAYREIVADDMGRNFPGVIGQPSLQPVDLDGIGLPGLLTTDGPTVSYRQPRGDGRYGAAQALPDFPDLGPPQPPVLELADLDSDGQLALVANTGALPGYFTRDQGHWAPFRAFPSYPTTPPGAVSTSAAISGSGYTDALLLEPGKAILFEGRGTAGYAEPYSMVLPEAFPLAETGGGAPDHHLCRSIR